jgi:hypothetical protein
MAKTSEVREVRIGSGRLDRQMTEAQARRYGARNMPGDLKRAGFHVCVFTSDAEINGGIFYRVSYGK